MAEYKADVLIIGSGPAGYTAGIYTARAGLTTLIVTGKQKGGQLILSSEVDNFPAFTETMTGFDIMEKMRHQAEARGVQMVDDVVNEVDFLDHPFTCSSNAGNSYQSKAIVIATGSSVNWLGLPSEKKFMGHGVSSCATCDGFFYRGKEVAVVGGGNTAAEEALYLSAFTDKVYLIHRRHSLRADMVLQQRIQHNRKIVMVWNTIIEEILGTENPLSVTGLKIRNVKTDMEKTLNISGLFVAIGHHPNTELFRNYLNLTSGGYIATMPDGCSTNVKGVFAAGDVCQPEYHQTVIAAGSGAKAALETIKYLR